MQQYWPFLIAPHPGACTTNYTQQALWLVDEKEKNKAHIKAGDSDCATHFCTNLWNLNEGCEERNCKWFSAINPCIRNCASTQSQVWGDTNYAHVLFYFIFIFSLMKLNRHLIETKKKWRRSLPRQYTNATECSVRTPAVRFPSGPLDCNQRPC